MWSQEVPNDGKNSQHFPILGIAKGFLCYLLMVYILLLLKYFRVSVSPKNKLTIGVTRTS